MPDQPNHLIVGNLKEAVAYALFLGIAKHEGKNIYYQQVPIVQERADWVSAGVSALPKDGSW